MPERTYTEEEMKSRIEIEVMAAHISELKEVMAATESVIKNIAARFDSKLEGIKGAIEENGRRIVEMRADFRREIERDFASKIELERVESKLSTSLERMKAQIDRIWLKVVGPVIGASFVIQWVLQNYQLFTKH